MPVFYLEMAVHHPSMRGSFDISKKVIQFPFQKENRFKEVWRSMFLYDNPNPTEDSLLYGDFYIEMDKGTFYEKKSMILDIIEYLKNQYNIPFYYLNLFITNRSLWLSIPAKVFAAKRMKHLHKVYRYMAEEIQHFLKSKNYKEGLDLSIYKWNGLIHALGSYLPKSKRWVSKFNVADLEDAFTIDDLVQAKYDNGFTYEDVEVIPEAAHWFYNACRAVLQTQKSNVSVTKTSCYEPMIALAKRGTLEQNRNLHIYSYSLYLKEHGYTLEQAFQHIQETFSNPYIYTRECKRTIESAFRGNKRYSYSFVKNFCDADLLPETDVEEKTYKNTFIVPRLFIEKLQEIKANQHLYKILLSVLYMQQIKRKPFVYSLHKEKYKSLIISYFDKLKEIGLITYHVNNQEIEAQLVFQPRSVYQSYIVLPVTFIDTKFFKESGREFVLYMELMRSSIKKNEHYVWFTNTVIKTLSKRLGMKKETLNRYFHLLKKWKMYFQGFIFATVGREYKEKIREIIKTIQSGKKLLLCMIKQIFKSNEKWGNIYGISVFFVFSIIKCKYSTFSRIRSHLLSIKGFSDLLW